MARFLLYGLANLYRRGRESSPMLNVKSRNDQAYQSVVCNNGQYLFDSSYFEAKTRAKRLTP